MGLDVSLQWSNISDSKSLHLGRRRYFELEEDVFCDQFNNTYSKEEICDIFNKLLEQYITEAKEADTNADIEVSQEALFSACKINDILTVIEKLSDDTLFRLSDDYDKKPMQVIEEISYEDIKPKITKYYTFICNSKPSNRLFKTSEQAAQELIKQLRRSSDSDSIEFNDSSIEVLTLEE